MGEDLSDETQLKVCRGCQLPKTKNKFDKCSGHKDGQFICCHISNLQPLTVFDNLSKHNKYNPKDFEDTWIYADGYKWRLCDNERVKE